MQATATHAKAIPVICHHERLTPNTESSFALALDEVAGRTLVTTPPEGAADPAAVAGAGAGAASGVAAGRVAAGTCSGLDARVKAWTAGSGFVAAPSPGVMVVVTCICLFLNNRVALSMTFRLAVVRVVVVADV